MMLGKILYGALFAVVLPALLIAWAHATAGAVTAPAIHAPALGVGLATAGALLMVGGWLSLWHHGGGLPMNAFPPPRFVTRGAYAIVAHPIYVGFCGICFGTSVAVGSASGLWLASPFMVLASAALVLGYERHDLTARFGDAELRPWLSLPPDEEATPTPAERLALYVLPMLAVAALHAVVAAAGPAPGAPPGLAALAGLDAPVQPFSLVSIPWVLAAPLVARSRRDLRAFAVAGLVGGGLVAALPLLLGPALAPSALGSAAALWALVAADAWGSRWPRGRLALRGVGLAIAAGPALWGTASIVAPVAGLLVWLAVTWRAAVWEVLRRIAERLANSWTEWRVGPVRIINHGLWGGLALFGGLALISWLVGPGHGLSMFLAALFGLVGAALWAQIVEGSPALLRPYGFYGGLLGVLLGVAIAPLTGTSFWLLGAACATAGTYVQATGRVRCLVQGCCHGHEAAPAVGIRVVHPRSRVVRLSPLGGVPVHPTQLYSILWNGGGALLLGRLWNLGAALHLIMGLYFVWNGLGRFVEEAYRGEPQTPVFFRLRLYQWAAIASVLLGVAFTALGESGPAPAPSWSGAGLGVAALFGLLTAFATGVDFPGSNRRFARLV